MKTGELMIGDWVICENLDINDKNKVTQSYKTQLTAKDFASYYNGNDEYVRYKPIPLSEEILEKNGYSYNETRDAWELIPNDGFGICKDKDDNCFYFCLGIFDAFNSYSDITYHYITKVEYVHELQHALKLCEIEKEIIL